MKKLILCLTVSAFAFGSAQAADDKAPASQPAASADKTTATAAATSTSTDCCSDGACKATKPVAMSPRAAQLAGK